MYKTVFTAGPTADGFGRAHLMTGMIGLAGWLAWTYMYTHLAPSPGLKNRYSPTITKMDALSRTVPRLHGIPTFHSCIVILCFNDSNHWHCLWRHAITLLIVWERSVETRVFRYKPLIDKLKAQVPAAWGKMVTNGGNSSGIWTLDYALPVSWIVTRE